MQDERAIQTLSDLSADVTNKPEPQGQASLGEKYSESNPVSSLDYSTDVIFDDSTSNDISEDEYERMVSLADDDYDNSAAYEQLLTESEPVESQDIANNINITEQEAIAEENDMTDSEGMEESLDVEAEEDVEQEQAVEATFTSDLDELEVEESAELNPSKQTTISADDELAGQGPSVEDNVSVAEQQTQGNNTAQPQTESQRQEQPLSKEEKEIHELKVQNEILRLKKEQEALQNPEQTNTGSPNGFSILSNLFNKGNREQQYKNLKESAGLVAQGHPQQMFNNELVESVDKYIVQMQNQQSLMDQASNHDDLSRLFKKAKSENINITSDTFKQMVKQERLSADATNLFKQIQSNQDVINRGSDKITDKLKTALKGSSSEELKESAEKLKKVADDLSKHIPDMKKLVESIRSAIQGLVTKATNKVSQGM